MANPPTITGLDKLLARLAPRAALARVRARAQFDALNSGWKGASRTRQALAGWHAPTAPPDEVTVRDLPTLHARSLDLLRDNPLASGAHHTKTQGVVGTGFRLNASVDREALGLADETADSWESTAERLWSIWANSKDAHLQRRLNFHEQLDVAFRAVLTGDHFIQLVQAEDSALPFGLALNHIAGRRVSTPDHLRDSQTLVAGIAYTATGIPRTAHVLQGQPNSQRANHRRVWDEIPFFHPTTRRRILLHLYRAIDADQSRGIPDLAAVIEPLKQLDRYTDAELDAAVKNALYAIMVESDQGEAVFGQLNYDGWSERRAGWYSNMLDEFSADGSHLVSLFPGDKMSAFDPARPNTAYDPFVSSIFKQIGVALELPQEVLTKTFQSSYSAARAALLQAQQFFAGRRAWLAANLCQPVYEAFIDEQVAVGRLAAPGYFADPLIRAAYLGAEWIGDAPGHIDETKAVDAAERRIAAGLSTRKRETAALLGEDWDKTRRQLLKEQRLLEPLLAAQSAAPTAAPAVIPSAEDLDRADKAELPA